MVENVQFKKVRAKLRLNLFLAMLLLIGSAMFSFIYGVVFLVNEWRMGQVAIGVASGAGAFILAFLLIGFFGVVYKRLHKKLAEVETQSPVAVNQQ